MIVLKLVINFKFIINKERVMNYFVYSIPILIFYCLSLFFGHNLSSPYKNNNVASSIYVVSKSRFKQIAKSVISSIVSSIVSFFS